MAENAPPPKFADWLGVQMARRGFGNNQSKLAAYLGTRPSTVNAWFTRGARPGYDTCLAIAEVLKVPPGDVLAAAGYPVDGDPVPPPRDMPGWATLIPSLSQRDSEYVGRLVESLAKSPAQPDAEPSPGASR